MAKFASRYKKVSFTKKSFRLTFISKKDKAIVVIEIKTDLENFFGKNPKIQKTFP